MTNPLTKLKDKVDKHAGVFVCARIHDDSQESRFEFQHKYEEPQPHSGIPECGKLKEFFSTFGNLTLFYHANSRDAAVYLASPAQWDTFNDLLMEWINDLDDSEKEELLPEWFDSFACIGEVPQSGNYFLTPLTGEKAGFIF